MCMSSIYMLKLNKIYIFPWKWFAHVGRGSIEKKWLFSVYKSFPLLCSWNKYIYQYFAFLSTLYFLFCPYVLFLLSILITVNYWILILHLQRICGFVVWCVGDCIILKIECLCVLVCCETSIQGLWEFKLKTLKKKFYMGSMVVRSEMM